MWKEVFDGETAVDGVPGEYFADEENSLSSRRVSAASDDSFDASCYVHVDNKLNAKMPGCLLNADNTDSGIENHFSKSSNTTNSSEKVTKNGKRVIRKRLSVSQFKATRFLEKNANNNSNLSNHANNNDSSSDSDATQKNGSLTTKEKRNTNVLSAKIQHLLFEMKRLRQLDRDILRKFLIINDTIEEQRWMVEEKQEAIKRSMSEEGEDPVIVDIHFDLVPEVPEEVDDDEESIQSVLSRQNSGCEVYHDTLPADLLGTGSDFKPEAPVSVPTTDSELVFTSSESASSLSGASSTLSSTTSFPASNRSSSPSTSHLSGSSPVSSFVGSSERNESIKKNEPIPEPPAYPNDNDIPVDIEGYYRMYGSSMKRGSYPFPRTTSLREQTTYDHHTTLDNAHALKLNTYASLRASGAPEYAYAKRNSVSSGPPGHQRTADGYTRSYMQTRPRSASASTDGQDHRNRVQRISVRPDGTREPPVGVNGLRRPYSANDKNSAAYRLLQHPLHQKRIARMNRNRQPQQWSFVPIEEQEPDVMYDNGRICPTESVPGSKIDDGRRDYQNLIDLSKQMRHHTDNRAQQTRQCPAPRRKPSGSGSAGSLTSSSSRTSSSSLTSSGSNSSLHSPTKFMCDGVDHYKSHQEPAPVWVQRDRSDYANAPYNQSFPVTCTGSKHYKSRQGSYKMPVTEVESQAARARVMPAKRTNLSRSYQASTEDSNHVLTVSYKPKTAGTNEAVYNWIQTQDDVTYL